MKKYYFLILALGMVFTLIQCAKEPVNGSFQKSPNLPSEPYDYVSTLESELFINDNTPADNAMSNPGATLGRVLFYDPALSINNTVSCGTCHKQSLAFSDDKALSVGFEGVLTSRNSPPIMNMRSSNQFFWDFSESSLENQVVTPVRNHIEMGMENMEYLIEKLQGLDYYKPLFKDAFGTEQVSVDHISKAMAQFLRSINSFNSRFDNEQQNNFEGFNVLEKLGQDVFMKSGCNSCHNVMGGAFFDFLTNSITISDFGLSSGYGGTGSDLANIGLDLVSIDQGAGNGRFKVPSLRNLAFTAPYMHDGRFRTLDEVIEHYDTGVQDNQHLDFRLKDENGQVNKLNLTPIEKKALKEFLFTLTDMDFMNDPKFSDPFLN